MAYQVPEYSMLTNSINKGLINKSVILESLISFKRAGANAIVSYYADKLDKIYDYNLSVLIKWILFNGWFKLFGFNIVLSK